MKTIFNILKITFKLCLLALLCFGNFEYLNAVFYNHDVDRGDSFHALKENSTDVIVLGSSHAQYSFIPTLFYEETGLYSYVLGSACQPLKVSYEMLKEAFKSQSPKLVILEVFTAMPMRDICAGDSCYVIAEYQMTGQEKYNTINLLPKEKAETYYNDFFSYHNDWKKMTSLEAFREPFNKEKEVSISLGYIEAYPSWPVDNFWHPDIVEPTQTVSLEREVRESLNNIKKFLDEHDSKLYLYKTPIDGVDEKNQAYLKAVWKWAEDNGVAYSDFLNRAADIDFEMVIHSDSYHAYSNGATYLTSLLAKETKDVAKFEHKSDLELDELYIARSPDLTFKYLNNEQNVYKVINRLQYCHGYVFGRFTDLRLSEKMKGDLNSLTKQELDFSKNIYFILKDSKLLVLDDEPIEYKDKDIEVILDDSGININGDEHKLAKDSLTYYYSKDYQYDYNIAIKLNADIWGYDEWKAGYDYYYPRNN